MGERHSISMSKGPQSTSTSNANFQVMRNSMELDKENITRKSMAPQSKTSIFGQPKYVRSPIQEKLEGGKKKSRNTLVGAKTTSQVQEELTKEKKRG